MEKIMVTEISMSELQPESELQSDDYLHVVMFYGITCGPCKATMPYYEACATFFLGLNAKMKFHKINAWEPEEQKVYCKDVWDIGGVPTFKIFYKGENILTRIGGGDEIALLAFLQEAVDIAFKSHKETI